MKTKALWRIRIPVTAASEDAVAALMEAVLGTPASIYTDVRTGRSAATIYLDRVNDWNAARKASLTDGLKELAGIGVEIPAVRIHVSRLAPEDWAESWKRHFQPLEIGRALLVLPSWSRRKPRRGQAVVTLDPGLSFGTGQHPTTRFCLEALLDARLRHQARSLLDAGCGSGILAIAGAKLGYDRIEAFDFDPDAVRVAGENAAKNGVRDQLKLLRRDLTRMPGSTPRPFDVVCANLTADLLESQTARIAARVAPDGTLVLAGILHHQFRDVEQAFARQGFKKVRSRREKEWRSGSFRRS
jgi:ribosomal protein L11 methyltransferase